MTYLTNMYTNIKASLTILKRENQKTPVANINKGIITS